MKKTIIAAGVLAALSLTGCATSQQQAELQRSYENLEGTLRQAQEAATVTCDGEAACDRAWKLTQVYVQQESGMKVRLATDTTIDTYAPTEYGMATFSATRLPVGNQTAIRLFGQCKGMYGTDGKPGPNYSQCATAVGVSQARFSTFVRERM
ncbi:hypothetical protein [Paraburkholderia sp.]|uniref:hypothetical protein n=1 Tax=Paraburkholderia sp. TaxID=1926495 RepID=UPI0039E546BD